MKLALLFLVLFTISSCANQTRRRGTDLSNIESEVAESSEEETTTKTEDRAPKGEIQLGLEGESAETVIIEGDETPEVETVPAKLEDKEVADGKAKKKSVEEPEKLVEVDCKKDPKHKSCIKTDDTDLIINEDAPE